MNRLLPLALAVAVLSPAAECRAEIAVGTSLEWLTCEAELVDVGRVEKVVSARAPRAVGDRVYHEVTVEVKETIKGQADARLVFLLDSYRKEDDARPAAWMRSNEPTLLFLTSTVMRCDRSIS